MGKCVFDDAVNEFAPKFKDADGLVVGSPVYYSALNATIQAFLQRLFYSASFDKTMKVGAGFVFARSGGTTASFDVLNNFFQWEKKTLVLQKKKNMMNISLYKNLHKSYLIVKTSTLDYNFHKIKRVNIK